MWGVFLATRFPICSTCKTASCINGYAIIKTILAQFFNKIVNNSLSIPAAIYSQILLSPPQVSRLLLFIWLHLREKQSPSWQHEGLPDLLYY